LSIDGDNVNQNGDNKSNKIHTQYNELLTNKQTNKDDYVNNVHKQHNKLLTNKQTNK